MTLDNLMALADEYSFASRNAQDRDSHSRAALSTALSELVAERDEHKENAMRNARSAIAFKAERDALRSAIKVAYGHLWHINNEPMTPIDLYEPEKAAYQARKALRDLLTHEERGEAINAVAAALNGANAP